MEKASGGGLVILFFRSRGGKSIADGRFSVLTARRYKKVKIVTYDWLEDSLQNGSRKREGEYLIKKIVKADRKKKAVSKDKERKALKKEGKSISPSFIQHFYSLLAWPHFFWFFSFPV
jgi:hypothetical protein